MFLDYLSKLQKILQLQAPNIYFCAKIEKNMNKASECFLLGKVDDAIFHWMEEIKRDPGRSTNSSVLVIASLLSCYRLREALLFLNWSYLHNFTTLPAVTQVLAHILDQYFTGKIRRISWWPCTLAPEMDHHGGDGDGGGSGRFIFGGWCKGTGAPRCMYNIGKNIW